MADRWLLFGFGLLFLTLTVAFAVQGAWLQAAISVVHTTATLGGFWWTTTHDEPVATRWS